VTFQINKYKKCSPPINGSVKRRELNIGDGVVEAVEKWRIAKRYPLFHCL